MAEVFPESSADKTEIIAQIAELSRLLGMIPNDDTVLVSAPVTNKTMELSKWLDDARKSFLKLSILLGKALNLDLR